MEAARKRTPLSHRPGEIARRIIGSLLELGFKAYGTAAAVSIALSDGETLGEKLYDGLAAVPNLIERYHQARYVFDHREEIQDALEFVHQNAPDVRQLETAVQKSYEALEGARIMFNEVDRAKEALADLDWTSSWTTILDRSVQAFGHLGRAWDAMPDLGAINHLADVAQNVTPVLHYLNNLETDFTRVYQILLCVVDNFARDEIAGTLGLMGAAFGVAFVLGLGAGFWGRRGRPGILVSTLQGWGARVFAGWYDRNLDYALGRPLYTVARRRIQGDIVAAPEEALDPDAYQELERHFERRLRENKAAAGA